MNKLLERKLWNVLKHFEIQEFNNKTWNTIWLAWGSRDPYQSVPSSFYSLQVAINEFESKVQQQFGIITLWDWTGYTCLKLPMFTLYLRESFRVFHFTSITWAMVNPRVHGAVIDSGDLDIFHVFSSRTCIHYVSLASQSLKWSGSRIFFEMLKSHLQWLMKRY